MPATGKKFATEDQLNGRTQTLDQKINAIRNGSTTIILGGVNQVLWVVTDIQVDGAGHITSITWKGLKIVDGIIKQII
jgi:hypothetical protein